MDNTNNAPLAFSFSVTAPAKAKHESKPDFIIGLGAERVGKVILDALKKLPYNRFHCMFLIGIKKETAHGVTLEAYVDAVKANVKEPGDIEVLGKLAIASIIEKKHQSTAYQLIKEYEKAGGFSFPDASKQTVSNGVKLIKQTVKPV